ncbi:MAG: hypothetical protein J6R77_08285, partial [Clostridia bacterium]|nr:hypothetical protein [Clostridia bacterium]
KGYKLYRAFLTMPAAGRATLRFGRVVAAAAELFANGQPVATLRDAKGEWQVPLAAPAGQKVELRVRLFAGGEAGGISDGVFLEN